MRPGTHPGPVLISPGMHPNPNTAPTTHGVGVTQAGMQCALRQPLARLLACCVWGPIEPIAFHHQIRAE